MLWGTRPQEPGEPQAHASWLPPSLACGLGQEIEALKACGFPCAEGSGLAHEDGLRGEATPGHVPGSRDRKQWSDPAKSPRGACLLPGVAAP